MRGMFCDTGTQCTAAVYFILHTAVNCLSTTHIQYSVYTSEQQQCVQKIKKQSSRVHHHGVRYEDMSYCVYRNLHRDLSKEYTSAQRNRRRVYHSSTVRTVQEKSEVTRSKLDESDGNALKLKLHYILYLCLI